MKKRLVKILIGVLVPVLLIGGGVSAYLALTAHFQVKTNECLTWVSGNEFDLNLYPGENFITDLTIHNESSVSLNVTLKKTITPKIKGLSIISPDEIIVEAQKDTTFTVEVLASSSLEIGETSVTIDFNR